MGRVARVKSKTQQPFLTTNFRNGRVALSMVIGADERTFEFWARHPKAEVPRIGFSEDVDALAVQLSELLKALGYEPLTEHLT